MTPKTLLAFILAGVIPLSGQVAATLNQFPDGSTEIRLRNNSSVPLTTLAISVDFVNRISQTPTSLLVYIDPVLDGISPPNRSIKPLATMPLLPQQEIAVSPEILVAVSTLSGKPIFSRLVTAGIFADGATFGDSGLLTRLAIRRTNMLLAVDTTLGVLSDAGRRNVPRGVLVERFKGTIDSTNYWYLPAEQQVGVKIYQTAIERLINVPEGGLGSAFPPDAFVAREAAQLVRQRATLLQAGAGSADFSLR